MDNLKMNTNDLVSAVFLDMMPSLATAVDFGIDKADATEVFGAYQYIIKHELVTVTELDAALGDGAALTALIQRGASECAYCADRVVSTPYDFMGEEE